VIVITGLPLENWDYELGLGVGNSNLELGVNIIVYFETKINIHYTERGRRNFSCLNVSDSNVQVKKEDKKAKPKDPIPSQK
jgi:hypothetical protein